MFEEYATFIHSMLLGICKHLADTLRVADSWVTSDQDHCIDQRPVLQCQYASSKLGLQCSTLSLNTWQAPYALAKSERCIALLIWKTALALGCMKEGLVICFINQQTCMLLCFSSPWNRDQMTETWFCQWTHSDLKSPLLQEIDWPKLVPALLGDTFRQALTSRKSRHIIGFSWQFPLQL
jgi:hypothetical protein